MFVEIFGLDVVTPGLVEPLVPMGVFREVAGMVTKSPLVPLEISGELVFMMTGDPLVILMVFRELVAVVTRGSLVPLDVSRELVAMVTGDLLVPPEISRDLVAITNRSLLVPLEVSRGLASMVTGVPLVPLVVSRGLAAMVTGVPLAPLVVTRGLAAMVTGVLLVPLVVTRGLAAMVTGVPLVPLVVSRGLVATVSPVIVGNPIGFVTETSSMLGPSGIFMGIGDFLVESSWETADSDTADSVFMMTGDPLVILMVFRELVAVVTRGSLVPLDVSRELVAAGEVSGEDTTLAVSRVEESRKVWFPGLSPISGTLFVVRLVVIELDVGIPETEERERVVVSDIHKGALSGDASVMFFAPTLPKRRRSRIISKATGMSRSWDLRVGKLEK